MTLKVIGSGFGRTGTMSLKVAIEQLGVGRCYHMVEVFGLPDAPAQWIAAADGLPDWEAIFEGFSASVDWPSCTFYRQLAAHYPEAKIVHTERPSEDWFASTQATIFSQFERPPRRGPWAEMAKKTVFDLFDGRQNDKDHAIGVYERHNAEVRRAIPAERLLIYEVAQGWGPLCEFLGVNPPEAEMPKINTREEFRTRVAAAASAAASST
jgi:sulfotransferase family protein